MQVSYSGNIKLALLAVVIIGGFDILSFPYANATTANGAFYDEDMHSLSSDSGCDQQECAGQHSDCQKHCLEQTASHTTVATLSTYSPNVSPSDVPQVNRWDKEYSDQHFFLGIIDRAPPTLQLLRSVIKRE